MCFKVLHPAREKNPNSKVFQYIFPTEKSSFSCVLTFPIHGAPSAPFSHPQSAFRSLLSPLKYVFDSVLDCCNYQQRNLIKKIYAIKLCVIFESLLLPFFAFLAKKCFLNEKELWEWGWMTWAKEYFELSTASIDNQKNKVFQENITYKNSHSYLGSCWYYENNHRRCATLPGTIQIKKCSILTWLSNLWLRHSSTSTKFNIQTPSSPFTQDPVTDHEVGRVLDLLAHNVFPHLCEIAEEFFSLRSSFLR